MAAEILEKDKKMATLRQIKQSKWLPSKKSKWPALLTFTKKNTRKPA